MILTKAFIFFASKGDELAEDVDGVATFGPTGVPRSTKPPAKNIHRGSGHGLALICWRSQFDSREGQLLLSPF